MLKLLVIGHDELHDAALFLDRTSLVAVSLAACRFSAVVARLPANVCLLRVQEIGFSIFDWRPEHVASRYRDLDDYDPLKPLEFTLSMWFAHGATKNKAVKTVTRVYSNPQTALAILKHTLRIMSASIYVNTSLFDVAQLVQSDAERGGIAEILSVTMDMSNVETSVFENLPLICGHVANVQIGPYRGISSSHQTDRFIRNSIARNVRSLQIAEYWSRQAPSDDYCDISEESLLDFCFGQHLTFTDEEEPVVSLWLNWIYLSDQFLNRFIEASEACDSDYSVLVYLSGRNVHAQDLSTCQETPLPSTSDDGRSGTFTFSGKHEVRVGYNPEFHFLLIERKARKSSARFFARSHFFVHEGNGRWKFHLPQDSM